MEKTQKNTDVDNGQASALKVDAAPFGTKDKVGYMFGDLGICLMLGLVNSFLTIYYTNVLGISGGVIGTLFLLARCFDGISDILIGRAVDVSKLTKEGRFRPWIKRGKYLFCGITIILFLPFVNQFSMTGKIVYVFVTYIAFGFLIDFVNIPYGSLASSMSQNPDDKAELSTFRSVGAAIGGALTALLIPMFVYVTSDSGRKVLSGNRFFILAIVLSSLAFICFIFTYRLTTERVQVKKEENVSIGDMFRSLGKNKPLLALIVADMFIVVNQSGLGTMMSYLFNDYFKNSTAMSIAGFFTYGCPILLAPLATPVIKKFGKKEACSATLLISSFIFFALYFLHITNSWVYLVLMFLGTISYSFFNLMVWALISDVIDYHQYVSGYREDGTIYALNSFARKVGQAIAGGLTGFLLQLIGYQTSTTGGVAQTAAVNERIYAISNLMPAILLLIGGLILIFIYNLDKKRLQEVEQVLNEINKQ